MKSLLVASSVVITLMVTGCTNNVPKCGGTEVLDLVKQVADESMTNQLTALKMFGLGGEGDKSFSYSVGFIRTTNTNNQTGAHECAAELAVTESGSSQTSTIPITYTIEMTDKGDEFYVNVFGL
jgi:hypothetical protein